MRKSFTRFFSLMLLLVTCCFIHIGYAQDCNLKITAANVELVTDVTKICNGDYVDYKVVGYSPEDYSFAFNYNPNNPTGQFKAGTEFSTPENSTFTVMVKENATGCISNTITVNAPDVSALVTKNPGIQDALCHGGQGEITINWTGGVGNLEYYVVPASKFRLPIANLASYKRSTWQVGVPADTYFVAVQNANGCANLNLLSTWKRVVINEPDPMVVQAPFASQPIVNNTCFGGTDGKYNVCNAVLGGQGPFKASIDGIHWVDMNAVGAEPAGYYEFTDLAAGKYTVTVKDVNGCTATRPFEITEPEPITFDIAIVDVACNKADDGKIIVTNVAGGKAPYTLKLEGGTAAVADQIVAAANGSATFTGLQPTYYSLTVTDANGCSVVYKNPNNSQNVIAVQSPADITFVPTATDPKCKGEKGTISIVAKVGGVVSSDVKYSFDNGLTWVATATKEVTPGTYQVMVSNINGGCPVGPISVTIEDKEAISAEFTDIKSPTCPGGSDGHFMIDATGGNGGFTYSVDGSGFYANNIIFETEGEHTVIVKDVNGCTSPEYQVTIPAVKINEIKFTDKTDVTCFGKNSGRINIDVVSWAYDRTPVIWYAKNKADVYTNGSVLDDDTPLTAGTYYIGATDAFNCFFDVAKDGTPDVIEVKITEAEKLDITAALVTEQATCFGDPDGVITITAIGGTPFINGTHAQYWLSTSNVDVSLAEAKNFSNFESYDAETGISTTTVQALKGTYYVYVKDNDCTITKWPAPIEVKGFDPVSITDPAAAALTHNNCNGEKLGAIVVAPATGGSGELVYTLQKLNGEVWTNVTGSVEVESSSFSGLAAGTYKVVVKDMEGCNGDETGNIVITEPVAPVSFTLTPTDITCNGANNGIVKITVTGGTPGTGGKYWFKIADQAWQEMISPKNVVITAKGTYSIQVKDSKGCTAAAKDVTINEPDAIALTLTSTNVTTSCINVPDGTITVEVEGGIEAGEYQVSTDCKTWVNTVSKKYTFNTIAAGIHTIYAKDDNGCISFSDITITQPVAITFSASVTANVLCHGSNEGVIAVTDIKGGVAPYNVVVNGTTKVAVDGAASFSELTAGTYKAVVTDAKGCNFSIDKLVVTEPTQLVLNANKLNDIGCTVPGKFTVNVTKGTAPYVYYWAKSDPATGHVLVGDLPAAGTKWSESNLAEVTEAGTYIIWAKDANGCIIGGEGNGTPVNEWRVKVTKPATEIVISAVVTGSPLCHGDESATITVTATGGMPVAPLAVKSYTTTINGVVAEGGVKTGLGAGKYTVVVTDEFGCSATKEVVVEEPAALTATLTKAEGSFTCPESVQGYIEVKAEGGTGNYSYELWRDGALFVKSQADNSFLVQINHVYEVKVTDINACVTTSNLIVIDRVLPVVAKIKETTCFNDAKASIVVCATGNPERTFFVRYRLNTDDEYSDWKAFDSEIAITDLVYANSKPEENFYYFQVKDSEGCEAETFTRSFVGTQHPLEVTALQEDDDLSASIAITGGISPYSYQVGNQDVVTLPDDGSSFQIVKLQAPSTTVTVFDAHGCFVTKTLNVAPVSVVAETEKENSCANEFEVELTFNRPVTIAEGDIVGGTFTPGTGTVFTVGMSGADLATVKLELKNTIVDASGNNFAGATYEYVIGDNTVPALVTKTPTLDNTLTNNHPTFIMTFNEDVKLGANGNLKVYKVGTTEAVLDIPVTAAMISGKVVTIDYKNTTQCLERSTNYFVKVDGSAIADLAGNKFAGICEATEWTFKTGANWATPNMNQFSVEFKVYPNPFVDFVKIDNASELSKVVVSNIAGQVVKEVVNPTSKIQLNELHSGVYFISLYDKDNVIAKTAKIVKR